MKHNILAISTLIIAMSGTAMADDNAGMVTFTGVVSDTTCDMTAKIGGTAVSEVPLGSVTTQAGGANTGQNIAFTLGPSTTCDIIALTTATFTFSSSNMTSAGIGNDSGTATDAYMTLTAMNSNNGPTDINQGATTVDIPPSLLLSDGLELEATLIGGVTQGTYSSAVSYIVAYN